MPVQTILILVGAGCTCAMLFKKMKFPEDFEELESLVKDIEKFTGQSKGDIKKFTRQSKGDSDYSHAVAITVAVANVAQKITYLAIAAAAAALGALGCDFIWWKVTMSTIRNLKIKTATCKRIIKELHSYEKVVDKEFTKTEEMKAKGAHPYDLWQQENVLAESRMMTRVCRKCLEEALVELEGVLAKFHEWN